MAFLISVYEIQGPLTRSRDEILEQSSQILISLTEKNAY